MVAESCCLRGVHGVPLKCLSSVALIIELHATDEAFPICADLSILIAPRDHWSYSPGTQGEPS